jgi:hypothetical protein
MRSHTHLHAAAVIFFLLLWVGGCASTARDVGAAAAPAVVRASLHEVNEPDDQQQLQRLVNSPGFQKAGQSIGEAVVIGVFNEANKLAGTDSSATTQTSAGTPVAAPGGRSTTRPSSMPASATPGAAAVAGLAGGGGLNGFVKSSVQEAFLAATNPEFRAGEEAMSEAIGEGFVSGMIDVLNKKGPDLGQTIRKQLGPIVQELIRDEIAPAVRDMLQQQLAPAALQVWREGAVETLKLSVRPDLQPEVQQNAQNMSIGAEHGTHQVMIESGLITPDGALAPRIKLYLWSAIGAIALVLIALLSLLLMLNLLVLHHLRHRNAPAEIRTR